MSAPTDSRREGKEPPRGPGRPRQGDHAEDVRARLIGAATKLFSQRGFGEVGVREVAGAAGVTPAMVSYYFGDKQGLYAAMLESVFERLIALAEEPWVPQLILREVLGGEGPLRERFIEDFARQMIATVLGLLGEGIAERRLRADLDPKLTVLSLMGLCVFPYLSHPVSGPVLGVELDESFRDRLIEHTVKLIAHGTLAEERTS
jgi:AcrR family transcriptional regulator